ncbi:nucleoside triphosphate pyrophosphatase [Frondihabitans sp. VKM Ac-2883]|uniref:Maf family protein n=1 Tax=Frondihabitans sp. VKM Ac-2883 TaxID=2783823 RepID=UPI00188D8D7D|nr:Maf family protein [Frondihabitans sp. VKM Ac-2883]MBF4575910.1 Maf family protein [Frondihabitans sp. VKM Ac-2883]
MPVRLYLASTSPARLALLRAAGIEPLLISPGVDEDEAVAHEEATLGRPLTAVETVTLLARAKAEAVIGAQVDGADIDGFILGGDSAFEIEGAVYGKPHDPLVATDRWRQMARVGRGTLHSGHHLIDHRGGRPHAGHSAAAAAHLTFADDLSDSEIAHYIASGEPLEVAGAFTIDGLASAFITDIEGTPSAVVGLSIPVLRKLLRDHFGIEWPELWNAVQGGLSGAAAGS